jgi:hypothetical protein
MSGGARLWRSVRDAVALFGWREAAATLALMVIVGGVVGIANAQNVASDAASVQAALDGEGAAAAARVALLLAPIPPLLRTLAQSLEYLPARIPPGDWAGLEAPLVAAMPFVSGIMLVDVVAAADRGAWEAAMTAAVGSPVVMWPFTNTSLAASPPAPVYYAVAAGAGPAAPLPGGDFSGDAPLAAAAQRALETSNVSVTGVVHVPRSGSSSAGSAAAYVVFVPVQWRGPATGGVARASLIGCASSLLRV